MTTLGEPSAQSLFLGTLHTAQALDRLSPLELVRVQGSCAPELTQEHLESLFKTARPVPAGDKSIDAWQYSPACHVELSSLGRSWKSELFLGGRGILTDDKGRRAVFDFSPAPPAP